MDCDLEPVWITSKTIFLQPNQVLKQFLPNTPKNWKNYFAFQTSFSSQNLKVSFFLLFTPKNYYPRVIILLTQNYPSLSSSFFKLVGKIVFFSNLTFKKLFYYHLIQTLSFYQNLFPRKAIILKTIFKKLFPKS